MLLPPSLQKHHGVPQGLVLGSIMLTFYMRYGINFHCYAEYTKLYLSMKPEETEPLARLKACLKEIKE